MWTFALVTPDAVIGGYLDFVLERLQAHGFEVRACRLLGLDVDRMTRMYLHQDDLPPPRATVSRTELPASVMAPLYLLAPACLLVLRRAEGAACETLLRCKGPADPLAASPGTVRAAGEHIIFNFVHCPDDPASAAIELAYLVGMENAEDLMSVARSAATTPLAPMISVEQLQLCLPAHAGWEALSFPMIANRLRCRVVQRFALTLDGDTRASASLLAAHAALALERAELLVAPSSVAERLRIAQTAHPAIHAALTAAVAGDKKLTEGLAALGELYDVAGLRRLQPILDLAGREIYLSALEQVAIDAHRHAFWSDAFPPADLG